MTRLVQKVGVIALMRYTTVFITRDERHSDTTRLFGEGNETSPEVPALTLCGANININTHNNNIAPGWGHGYGWYTSIALRTLLGFSIRRIGLPAA